MELHAILEHGVKPNSNLWYVLSSVGECPSMRVGHSCTFVPGKDGENGHIYVIGGANPDGPFNDTYVLDLSTFSWDRLDIPGLKPRYEHAAFYNSTDPDKIYVFGGADQSGNHNDIQCLDINKGEWASITTNGTMPNGRTYHVSFSLRNKFYVYSGGHCASDPVGDRQVHEFDIESRTWTVLNVRGEGPKPRMGHVMAAINDKVYVHGGMSGTTFYDDLYILDPVTPSWSKVKQKKNHPSGRAAHGAVAKGDVMYIFGGMNRDGALDEMHQFNTTTLQWSQLAFTGPPPACRLDFGACLVQLRVSLSEDCYNGDIRSQAKEVLQAELRLGSAGSASRDSLGSASSERSLDFTPGLIGPSTSDESGQSDTNGEDLQILGKAVDIAEFEEDCGSKSAAPVAAGATLLEPRGLNASQDVPVSAEADVLDAASAGGPVATVELCFVIGGMDTEGQLFDDMLVTLL